MLMVEPTLAETLLPGLGTIVLAILSGAGGSALLELIWKPRRDRRRVAGALLGEILVNTELAILWSHARQKNPLSLPADLSFSNLGWHAVSGLVSELPADLVKSVLLLYRRYEHLNFCVQEYSRAADELQTLETSSQRSAVLRSRINSTIDVFNTSIDKAFDEGKSLAAKLLPIAGIDERREADAPTRDYAKDVDNLLGERAQRLERLGNQGRTESLP